MEYTSQALEGWLFQTEGVPPRGTHFTGLSDTTKAMVACALRRQGPQPLLVILSSGASARAFVDCYRFFAGKEQAARVHYLPALDFDYYRSVLPNPATLCERNVGLFHAMNDPAKRVFVTTLAALLQKVFPVAEFARATRTLVAGEEVDRDALIRSLVEAGYQRQPTATDPGIFAVRGNVIDVFCPLYENPARIEFFGDVIEEVRFFEAETQRSLDKVQTLSVLPVGQSLLPQGEAFQAAFAKVKERLDSQGIAKTDREILLEKIESGNLPPEASFLFPLLSGGSEPLTAYFPSDACWISDGDEAFADVVRDTEIPRLELNHGLFEKQPLPIAPVSDLFLNFEQARALVDQAAYYFDTFATNESGMGLASFPVGLEGAREKALKSSTGSLDGFAQAFRQWVDQGYRIHIVFHTRTHAERFQMLFDHYNLRMIPEDEGMPAFPRVLKTSFEIISLWQGYLTESRVLPGLKTVLLSEEAIFGQKKRTSQAKSRNKGSTEKLLTQFREMQVGDYVVHKQFGIGRYLGLKPMNFLGVENDYVLLEYKDGDKLYIPVYRLNVLQKFVGGESGSPVLDKLGSDRWDKVKGKAKRAIAELAAELMKIQARRKLVPAYPFSAPGRSLSCHLPSLYQ